MKMYFYRIWLAILGKQIMPTESKWEEGKMGSDSVSF